MCSCFLWLLIYYFSDFFQHYLTSFYLDLPPLYTSLLIFFCRWNVKSLYIPTYLHLQHFQSSHLTRSWSTRSKVQSHLTPDSWSNQIQFEFYPTATKSYLINHLFSPSIPGIVSLCELIFILHLHLNLQAWQMAVVIRTYSLYWMSRMSTGKIFHLSYMEIVTGIENHIGAKISFF